MPLVSVRREVSLQATEGSPPSPFFLIVQRIADRLGPEFERAFLEHAERLGDRIDEQALLRALGVRRADDVIAALRLAPDPMYRAAIRRAIDRTMLASGTAVASATAAEIGIDAFTFDGARPRFALVAQRQAARFISRIDDETREAVRAIISRSFLDGLTTDDQARLIRQIVGLRKGHAKAVANLKSQLRRAAQLGPGAERDRLERLITRRRLDAVTKQRLRSAIRRGTVTPQLIDEAAETYKASLLNRRAKDIARTEGQHAANAGQHEAWLQAADDGLIDRKRARRVPIVTPDERLRPSHAAIPGMNVGGVPLDEPFETPGGPAMHPPWPFDPYNCLLPGTEVSGSYVGGLKAQYSGEVVRLVTAGGRDLTVTPNHPILTPSGFVAAKSLGEGDDVLCHTEDVGFAPLREQNVDQDPALVEKVLGALYENRPVRRLHVSGEDLHGDAVACEGDIEVVLPDWVLALDCVTALLEKFGDGGLMMPAMCEPSVSGLGSLDAFRKATLSTANGLPRRRQLALNRLASFLSDLLPLDALCVGLATNLHASAHESFSQCIPAVAGSVADGLQRLAALVRLDDGAGVDIVDPLSVPPTTVDLRANWQIELDATTSNGRRTDAEVARDLLERHVGFVERDELIEINVSSWHGHVYDLQSVPGYHVASGIYVSNCRCGVGLVFSSPERTE